MTGGRRSADGGPAVRAARELAVRVNTVAYRLQRIRTISGLNLDRAEDRPLAGIAPKIFAGTLPAR